MASNLKKSSKIGLKNLHYAIYNPETFKYGTPVFLETIKEMTVALNIAEGKEYNDDRLFEILDTFDNFEIGLVFTDLTPKEQAILLGYKSVGAIRLSGTNDNPPWIALMGERTKKDGSKRYFKYFKGKARLDSEDASSKTDSVEAQPDNLTITFSALEDNYPKVEYQNISKAIVDTSDSDYLDEADTWFTDVIEGQTELVPPAGAPMKASAEVSADKAVVKKLENK